GDHPGDPAHRGWGAVHRHQPRPLRPVARGHPAGHRRRGGAHHARHRGGAVLRRQAEPADDAQRAQPYRCPLRVHGDGRRPDGHRRRLRARGRYAHHPRALRLHPGRPGRPLPLPAHPGGRLHRRRRPAGRGVRPPRVSRATRLGSVVMSRPTRSARALFAATLLFSESLVVLFAGLVAYGLRLLPVPTLLWGGGVLALWAVVAGVLVRRSSRAGYVLGSVLQAVLVATGLLLGMMYVVGGVFALLWVMCLRIGGQIDAERVVRERQEREYRERTAGGGGAVSGEAPVAG